MLSKTVGGPETLELTELPDPVPGTGEILIRVYAAGVNFPDILVIRDLYQMKPPRPFAPGSEVAGVVQAVGKGVEGFAVGDRVLSLCSEGGYATHVAVQSARVAKIPESMPFDQAAAFYTTYGTSFYALQERGRLQPGETLLVLGAAAVEIGKAMGARVIAGVSSSDKAAFCRQLGADDTIVYPAAPDRDTQKSFSQQIKDLIGGEGADVIYDAVGGDYAEPALRAMAWQGRYLVVGFPAGIPKIPLNLALLNGCQILGVFWGESWSRDPDVAVRNKSQLMQLYEQGKLRPCVYARFPLEQAAVGMSLLEDRKVMGKVVLLVD